MNAVTVSHIQYRLSSNKSQIDSNPNRIKLLIKTNTDYMISCTNKHAQFRLFEQI